MKPPVLVGQFKFLLALPLKRELGLFSEQPSHSYWKACVEYILKFLCSR